MGDERALEEKEVRKMWLTGAHLQGLKSPDTTTSQSRASARIGSLPYVWLDSLFRDHLRVDVTPSGREEAVVGHRRSVACWDGVCDVLG